MRRRPGHYTVLNGTIDALLAQLCLRHDLELLTTDLDFDRVAERAPLRIWRQSR